MNNREQHSSGQGEPFHRVHRAFFVGAFTLVPVVLIPAFLIYTLGKKEWFQDWRELRVIYETSYGVAEGAAVTVSDITVGHVQRVDLTPEGKALVSFRILTKDAQLVRKDSRAMLTRKNMVFGDWVIALTKGSLSYSPVEEGDTLVGVPPMQLDVVVDQVRRMVSTVDSLLHDIEHGKGLVAHLIHDDTLVKSVRTVVRDFDRVARNADVLVHHGTTAFDKFGKLSDAGVVVGDSIKSAIDSVGPAVDEAKRLLSGLNDASGQLTPVIKQAQVDLQQVEVLVRGLQNHPLLKRSVEKGKANMAADSTSAAPAPAAPKGEPQN